MMLKRTLTVLLCFACIFSVLCLSVSASEPSLDNTRNYIKMRIDPSLFSGSGINSQGVPYGYYNLNAFVEVPHQTQSDASNTLYMLMTHYIGWKEPTTQSLYYSYAPVALNEIYSKVPYTNSDGYLISPMAIALPESKVFIYQPPEPNSDSNVGTYVDTHSFSSYGLCRFAVCVRGSRLYVWYNPGYFSSWQEFADIYNGQEAYAPDMGLIYVFTHDPPNPDSDAYQAGYDTGFDDGVSNTQTPLGVLFGGVNRILNINLFGDITLGTIVYVFLGLGALFVVLKMFAK